MAAERLSLKLALSCIANLSWIGMSPEMAEEAPLPPLLAKCLVDCVGDVSLRPYALPATYNMSAEYSVLAALEAASADPLLVRLASESEGLMTKYAKHTRKNLKKHRKAVALAARPPKEPKEPSGRLVRGLGRRASKAKRGERSDAENAPPQGATLVAGENGSSNTPSPSKEPAKKRKGFRGARFAPKFGSVGLRGRRSSKTNQNTALVAVLAAQGELAAPPAAAPAAAAADVEARQVASPSATSTSVLAQLIEESIASPATVAANLAVPLDSAVEAEDMTTLDTVADVEASSASSPEMASPPSEASPGAVADRIMLAV